MLLEALPVYLRATFLLPSVFPAGSRQQKENTITQMCIYALPNRSRIYYTNMQQRRIAPVLCVWAACIMCASWDIVCKFNIVILHCSCCCAQHVLHLYTVCEYRSADAVLQWSASHGNFITWPRTNSNLKTRSHWSLWKEWCRQLGGSFRWGHTKGVVTYFVGKCLRCCIENRHLEKVSVVVSW